MIREIYSYLLRLGLMVASHQEKGGFGTGVQEIPEKGKIELFCFR